MSLPPLLADRFAVTRELGRGGMAVVYLAHDRQLDRQVAVKVFDAAIADTQGQDRFAQEIRLTSRLVHPHIVPLFDSGRVGERIYYVMPYVESETLRQRLDRAGPFPSAAIIRLALDLSEALAYAHGQGIVHRDIKPENIFCTGDRALLADFGIAKQLGSSMRTTDAGMIVGTLAYMSPEQASGDRDLDGRSDLYALGCLLYELTVGEPPFVGANPMAVLAQHLTSAPTPLSQRAPTASPILAATIMGCLEKDPARRPASAIALLEQLRVAEPMHDSLETAVISRAARPKRYQRKPEVIALTDQAHVFWSRGMHGGADARAKLEMAKAVYERALVLDPNDVEAIAGVAMTIDVMGRRGFIPREEAAATSWGMMLQASSLPHDSSAAHALMAVTWLYDRDDFDLAGIELQNALDIDPRDAKTLRQYANWLKMMGRVDEALVAARAATTLDPSVPFNFLGLGDILMSAGRYDEAIGPLRDALRRDGRYDAAFERLEMACHRAGRHDDALSARRARLGLRGATERLTALDAAVREHGWAEARRADIERELIEHIAMTETQDPFKDHAGSRSLADVIILGLAELDRWNEAMDWVERGYHQRPGRLRRVLTDLLFDRRGLAVDSRYAPLLRTAGLQELI